MENLSGKILLTMMTIMSLVLYFTNTYPNGDMAYQFALGAVLSFIGIAVLQLASYFMPSEA